MNELHKFKVTIDGTVYTLMSDEPEEIALQSVTRLNTLLQEIKQKNPSIERYQAVIVVAIQLLNQLVQFEKNFDSLNSVCHSIIQKIDTELNNNF